MDSFRLGGARRALAPRPGSAASGGGASRGAPQDDPPQWWRETIPEEEEAAFDGAEPGTVLWEQRRAALAERCVCGARLQRRCFVAPAFC